MSEALHDSAIDKTTPRRTFTVGDDIILLMAVNNAQVWACAARTVMKVWDTIADKVNCTPNVIVAGKNGPARQSGTTEEYSTREQLLTDIHQQMQDHVEENDKSKQQTKRKADAIET
ncbi:hypothetical protein Ae201684P_004021 [Aphanomyces euteiches]|nr:hypothetical protein Ae201684P_004021 [Aphanomyces euteiches]KAH9139679.1 hypothetical protein AeRB84_016052 [Aphanomyces euteiches]